MFRHQIQLMPRQFGQQLAGNGHRIDRRKIARNPDAAAGRIQKAHIKGGVVRNKHRIIPAPIQKLTDGFVFTRSTAPISLVMLVSS